MQVSNLKKRWCKLGDVKQILKVTKNFSISPFGQTEAGLNDFRGISLSANPTEFNGVWEDKPHKIDLIACDFSESKWEGFDLTEAKVDRSVFRKVMFIGKLYFSNVMFTDCFFDSCVFKGIHFTKVSLVRTSFLNLRTRLGSDITFSATIISECHFTGEMKKIHFGTSPIANSSFSEVLADSILHEHTEVLSLNPEKKWDEELRLDSANSRKEITTPLGLSNTYQPNRKRKEYRYRGVTGRQPYVKFFVFVGIWAYIITNAISVSNVSTIEFFSLWFICSARLSLMMFLCVYLPIFIVKYLIDLIIIIFKLYIR